MVLELIVRNDLQSTHPESKVIGEKLLEEYDQEQLTVAKVEYENRTRDSMIHFEGLRAGRIRTSEKDYAVIFGVSGEKSGNVGMINYFVRNRKDAEDEVRVERYGSIPDARYELGPRIIIK